MKNEEIKNIYLEAVKDWGSALGYVPKKYIDKDICLEAVKNWGLF